VTTLNYSAITNLRTLQIATAHAKSFQLLSLGCRRRHRRRHRRRNTMEWTRHVKIIGN
jgi:hypothetical protein